jgi:heptosyltransferase-2
MRPELKTAYLQARGLILQVLKAPLWHFEQSTQGAPSASTRILIIRIDRVGDLVLTTPAFAAIKTAFPNSMLTVLASRGNVGLLLHHPWVDEVFVYDPAASVRDKINMIKSLRARRFDIIIDPLTGHDVAPAVLACLIRAPIRIGFSGFGREVFFNRTASAAGSDRHVLDAVSDLLHLIGVEAGGRDPQLFIGTEEMEWAGRWADRVNPKRKRLVGIHPGAYYETQRWGEANFAGLIRRLSLETDCCVVLLGGLAEKELVRRISEQSDEVLPVFISGDLRQALAMISRLDFLVCNNSGPLHMAAALSVPTVSFMGPTEMSRWMPRGEKHRVLRADDLECIGCNLGICPSGTLECRNRINPEMMFHALKDHMESLMQPPF